MRDGFASAGSPLAGDGALVHQSAMQTPSEPDWRGLIRKEISALETSGIVEVFDYGRNRQGLIPLWVGEGDLPTPAFIADAAKASIDRGETFYTYQAGVPELRAAISALHDAHYGPGLPPERFFVTIGGMHALDLAVKLTVGPGEEALVLAPAWPNFAGALEMQRRARPSMSNWRRGRPGGSIRRGWRRR